MSSSETKPEIVLYTASTMNGWKPVIFLEEAQISYELIHVDFSKNEQKSPQYVQLNPNGRIPTIIDRSNDDFVVFESGAIFVVFGTKVSCVFTRKRKGSESGSTVVDVSSGRYRTDDGSSNVFSKIAIPNGERHPFAIDRYIKESRRLLEVLDRHLERKTYLVNEEFTIADIAMYPWARCFIGLVYRSTDYLTYKNGWNESTIERLHKEHWKFQNHIGPSLEEEILKNKNVKMLKNFKADV